MNQVQTDHINRISEDSRYELIQKYIRGTEEHGTNLSEDFTGEQLLDFIIEEILDLTSYAYTLREKMRRK